MIPLNPHDVIECNKCHKDTTWHVDNFKVVCDNCNEVFEN